MKCHYFPEKELLLKKAIEIKAVTTTNSDQIQIIPDFIQAVSKQQEASIEVRSLLQGCQGVCYSLRYPAILRITTDGQEASFKDPKLTKEFILKKVVCKGSKWIRFGE